jgi:hypothetical protein
MIHPHAGDPSKLTIPQLEEKIMELSRKYFMSHNPQLQEQISTFLEIYRSELQMKIAQEQLRQKEQNGDNGLDDLIKVS